MFNKSGSSYNEMTDEQFKAAIPEKLRQQKRDNIWRLGWLTGLKLNESDIKYLGVDDLSLEKAKTYLDRGIFFQELGRDLSASFLETRNVNAVVDGLLEKRIAENLDDYKNLYQESTEIKYTSGSLNALIDVLKVLQTSKNMENFDGNSERTKTNLKKIIDTVLQNSFEFRLYSKQTLNFYVKSLEDFLDSDYLKSNKYATSNIEGNLKFLISGMRDVANSLPEDPKMPEGNVQIFGEINNDPLLKDLPNDLKAYELLSFDSYSEFNSSNVFIMDGLNDNLDIHLTDSDIFKYFPLNELYLSYFLCLYNYKSLMDSKVIPDKSNSPIVISDIPVNLALKIIHLFPDLKISYRGKKISKPENIKKVLGLLSNSTEVVTISGKFSNILDNPNFQKLVDKAVDFYGKKEDK